MRKKRFIAMLALLLVLSVPLATQASVLGDLLKVGGIGAVVKRFGGEINKFINTITFQKNAGNDFTTKVVPIISMGDGKQIGAVQVTGSPELVEKTAAVLQLEGKTLGSVRVRALIPSDTTNPLKFNRVQGVGVSALIDISI